MPTRKARPACDGFAPRTGDDRAGFWDGRCPRRGPGLVRTGPYRRDRAAGRGRDPGQGDPRRQEAGYRPGPAVQGQEPAQLPKKQVLQVIPKASPLDAYLVKRDKVGPSAQAEYDLGLWCEQNQLGRPGQGPLRGRARLRQDVRAGPQEARACVHDGQWLSRDELRAGAGAGQVQGEVGHRGRAGQARRVGPGRPRRRPRGCGGSSCSGKRSSSGRRTAGARPRTS